MNTVSVNTKQILSISLGLFVIAAGIIVNLEKFGTMSNIPVFNIGVYAACGMIVLFAMMYLARD
jgi:hypothetical protein